MELLMKPFRFYVVACRLFFAFCTIAASLTQQSFAQTPPNEILLRNVRVLDVVGGQLGSPTSVLVRGNRIASIDSSATAVSGATTIDGHGQTLMPGLIDVHVHLTFGSMLLKDLYDPSTTPEKAGAAAAASAGQMLMRGFTAVRDMGGPIFPLKQAIDSGKTPGPRIWPSGAIISQTSGHGDFRTPSERSRRFFGKPSRAEEFGATFIADGRDGCGCQTGLELCRKCRWKA
jgi:imidazolonepropionase-like amidohydrolase